MNRVFPKFHLLLLSGLLARTITRLSNLLKLREFTNDLTLIHIVEK